MRLTDTAIKALKPKDKRYTATDGDGLYLEVYPTGGKVWRYRYRLNGKREKITIGKYPAVSLKEARLRRNRAAEKVAGGLSPAQEKRAERENWTAAMTLRDFGNQYYAEVVTRDRKKPIQMGRYLKNDIFPFIGDTKVGDLTTEDVRSVIWRKKDHGFDAAAGDIRGLLKRMLDYAVTLGLLQANPVLALPMRHVHKARHRDRALSANEIGEFLRAVNASNIRRQFKLAFHLLLLTMVRKGELMGAQWEELDPEKGEWHIPAANMKTGKPHIVYLSSQAANLFEELRGLASGSDWVLPGSGTLVKPFAHNTLNKTLQNVMEGSEIERFTIHDLRRTASTLLHEAGFNSDVIEKALAHEQKGVRGIYNRAQYADQRREMHQWWADFVDAQIEEDRKVIIGRFGAQA
jgi:integrase